MVRVIDQSVEEQALEERTNRLIEIAKKVMGDDEVRQTGLLGLSVWTSDGKSVISVSNYKNSVIVTSREYLDGALRLAGAYEAETGEEFIVVKKYSAATTDQP